MFSFTSIDSLQHYRKNVLKSLLLFWVWKVWGKCWYWDDEITVLVLFTANAGAFRPFLTIHWAWMFHWDSYSPPHRSNRSSMRRCKPPASNEALAAPVTDSGSGLDQSACFSSLSSLCLVSFSCVAIVGAGVTNTGQDLTSTIWW